MFAGDPPWVVAEQRVHLLEPGQLARHRPRPAPQPRPAAAPRQEQRLLQADQGGAARHAGRLQHTVACDAGFCKQRFSYIVI